MCLCPSSKNNVPFRSTFIRDNLLSGPRALLKEIYRTERPFKSFSQRQSPLLLRFFFTGRLQKTEDPLGAMEVARGESAFTFLSDVVSLLGRATRLLAPLSLSPWQLLLSIARYQPLCHSEKAAALTSRSRRHFFFLVDLPPLALALISSTHLWSCVTSRRLVYPDGLYSRMRHLFLDLHKRVVDSYLNAFLVKLEWILTAIVI